MNKTIIKNQSEKGFSVIELLIYMAVFSVLLVVLTSAFTAILDVSLESNATASTNQDGRYILAKLSYDIHQASSITSPTLGSGTASSLQLTINGVANTYSLDGSGNLVVTNNLGTDMLNSSDTSVSGVSFQTIGNTGGKLTEQINFTVTSKTQRTSGNDVKTFGTTVGLR